MKFLFRTKKRLVGILLVLMSTLLCLTACSFSEILNRIRNPIEPEETYEWQGSDTISTSRLISFDAEKGKTEIKSFAMGSGKKQGMLLRAEEEKGYYSGKFNGVFKGDLNIKYAFTSQDERFANKYGFGWFRFTVQSLNNPDQMYSFTIQPQMASKVIAKSCIYNSAAYGKYSGSDEYDYISAGMKKTADNLYYAMYEETNAPKFNAEDLKIENTLYINEDEGGLSIYYDLITLSNGKATKEKSPCLRKLTASEFDMSKGYEVYFNADFDTEDFVFYSEEDKRVTVSGIDCEKINQACLFSISGYALGNETVKVEETKNFYKLGEQILTETPETPISLPQGTKSGVYEYSDYVYYTHNANGKINSFSGEDIPFKIQEVEATATGNYSLNLDGKSYPYKVMKSLSTQSLFSIDEANISTTKVYAQDYLTGFDTSYSALQIGTENNEEPYSGKFNGTFYDTVVIEYKFNGKSGSGNNFGSFKWILSSVADSTRYYTIEIGPQVSWKFDYYDDYFKYKSYDTFLCGYYSNQDGEPYVGGAEVYERDYLINGTEKGYLGISNGVPWRANDTQAPRFYTSEKSGSEKLYLEVVNDTLKIYYQLRDGETKSEELASFDTYDFNISEGFNISFKSDWDPTEYGYEFIDDVGNKTSPLPTKRSATIDILSLNGIACDKGAVAITGDTETSVYLEGKELLVDSINYVKLGGTYGVTTELKGYELLGMGNGFVLSLPQETKYLDTSSTGEKYLTVEGESYRYTVCETAQIMNSANSLVTVNDATAAVQTHTTTATQYTGLTIGATNNATPYSGNINGKFTGSTTIEYKFNGENDFYGEKPAGNCFGNFRWTITSVKNPTQSFTVEIYQNGSSINEGGYGEVETTQIIGYKTRPEHYSSRLSEETKWFYDWVTRTNQYNTGLQIHGKDTGAPLFHTDGIATTEKIYFEVVSGCLQISYDALGSNFYVKKIGNGDAIKTMLCRVSADEFDVSEGYRISFASDIDNENLPYTNYNRQTDEKYSSYKLNTSERSTTVTIIAITPSESDEVMKVEENGTVKYIGENFCYELEENAS